MDNHLISEALMNNIIKIYEYAAQRRHDYKTAERYITTAYPLNDIRQYNHRLRSLYRGIIQIRQSAQEKLTDAQLASELGDWLT